MLQIWSFLQRTNIEGPGASTRAPFPVNEIDDSMINDLISTTLGGMALGEMSHRLYAEAERNGSILRLGGLFLHEMSLLKACL